MHTITTSIFHRFWGGFLFFLICIPLYAVNLPSWDDAWLLASKYDPGLHNTHCIIASRSMYPVLDWDSIVITETVPFSQLWIGDIVEYSKGKIVDYSSGKVPTLHRIIARNADGSFVIKGDSLNHPDADYLTPDNFISRACIVIYYDTRTIPLEEKIKLWKNCPHRDFHPPTRTVSIMYLTSSAPRIKVLPTIYHHM